MSLRILQNEFFSKALEQIKNTKFIKLHILGSFIRKKMNEKFNNLLFETLKMQRLSFSYSALDNLITTIAQIVLFLVGGYFVLNGDFSIGLFTIFSMYFAIMLGSVKYFFNLGKTYQNTLVSYSRINDIVCLPLETCGNIQFNSVDKIEVKNLSFSSVKSNVLSMTAASVSKLSVISNVDSVFSFKGLSISLVLFV